MIIAVAAYPGYRRLQDVLGGRRRTASTIFILLALVVLIIPSVMLASTLVESAQGVANGLFAGSLKVPAPPPAVAGWPLIGERLHAFWTLASQNLEAALQEILPQIKVVSGWLLSTAAGAGLGILQFIVAIIIAGVLLAHSASGHRAARAIAVRLAGTAGVQFADLAEATVRSVARGILGVALIQSLLAGLGFLAIGVPAAGLWALLCLLLSVVQIGIFPITVPMIIYVFSTAETVPAILFLIWMVVVGTIDNVLKPILLGRGVEVPMVIIFVGAIGGFLAMGIIGLFVGSVVLALGYTLFLAWLGRGVPGEQQTSVLGTADGQREKTA
jgi:predicted PurR-regulated permease PerM